MQEAMIKGCQETGDLDMMRSSSTAFLARDMARLLDALGQEKLNYWGFSYGTAVGQIFAAIFPDRVGRMVLDGNDNAKGWNDEWEQGAKASLQDTNVSNDPTADGKSCSAEWLLHRSKSTMASCGTASAIQQLALLSTSHTRGPKSKQSPI